jgi:hypothetical protein
MEKVVIAVVAVLIVVILFFSCVPAGRAAWNNWFFDVQKADDATRYETKKKVEDTCRAMISSYEADRLTYEQYKNSDIPDEKNIANQAKIRANRTVASYNNYVLENSFIWEDNVPADIRYELSYLN